MRKAALTVTFLIGTLVLTSGRAFAQEAQSTDQSAAESKAADQNIQLLREDIRADRKQITAANMALTPEEATKFWPLYDQYIQETIKINDVRWSMMKDYSTNYGKMTDQQAQDYIKKSASVDKQLIELREKYVSIFEKVISPMKTSQWYQIDRRMDMLINLQLSTLVPMVQPQK